MPVTNNAKKLLLAGSVPFTTAGRLKMALFTNAVTWTPAGDGTRTTYSTNGEVADTAPGYTAGGVTLANVVVHPNAFAAGTAAQGAWLDSDDAVWTATTITNFKWAVLYETQNNEVIAYYDLGDQTTGGQSIRITTGTNTSSTGSMLELD